MAAAASLAAAVARVKSFSSEVARATGRQTSISEVSARAQPARLLTEESIDADDAAVFELLEQMVASDPWSANVDFAGASPEPDELPDSARADLASDIGRVALESILRNVTFVVSTRIFGSFNNVRLISDRVKGCLPPLTRVSSLPFCTPGAGPCPSRGQPRIPTRRRNHIPHCGPLAVVARTLGTFRSPCAQLLLLLCCC